MSGRGDEQAELAILRALDGGPVDVLDLLPTLRTALPGVGARQEGSVHALLHRLLRQGRVVAVGAGPRGLARYALPGTPSVAAVEDAPFDPAARASSARAALRAVASVRDPADRGRIQADIQAHLDELGEDQSAFGSARGLRTLLHRVDRGRPTVCLIKSGGDGVRRFVLHEGPWIAGAALIWILLKVFVLQTYVIPSESMVPTLLRWDRVVVFRFAEGEAPERYSVTTFEGDDKTLVKRLIGLPGESIGILHGDVFINGELLVKPDEVREALRTHIGSWDLRSKKHPPGWTSSTKDDGATRVLRSGPFEAYTRRAGATHAGDFSMRDGYAQVRLAGSRKGFFELQITRGPNERLDDGALGGEIVWRLRLEGAQARLQEIHKPPGAAPEVIVDLGDGALGAGGDPVEVSLSYVDGVLRASAGTFTWQGARRSVDGPMAVALIEPADQPAALRISVDRDIHYSHAGEWAVPGNGPTYRARLTPHDIPAGHLFFLGDNTTNSTDSRFSPEMGDVPVDRVVGPVSVRIWPPSRWGKVR